jgi:hypothetical protein
MSEYEEISITDKAQPILLVCRNCGSVVYDTVEHNLWHSQTRSRSWDKIG